MDEKLQELLYKVQMAAVDIGNTAAALATSAVRGAEELVETGRQKARLIDLKAEVNLRLREIGELVYGTHTGEPADSEVLFAKLREIDELKAEIAQISGTSAQGEEKEPVQAEICCPNCGAAAQEGDIYCRGCGARL
ncbi:zinc ribbon domain-containing protein [Oscillibacter sp. MSJ-2]|uniref:Zinc ribbon domain-containing protein n=1 Tax=Dysosmobacter acutus TaxID=2841504 RepID=A0ABS6F8S9_9FIRM|nr:zinc ribbon domain-containing protein [Dysosmobacter acutus]MBU5625704.1 zinc ribbon domain-containing protein [Dysosmobacter acutus]